MSGTRERKQRPWRTLRCVVEVKVPPSNRSDEKDLIYHIERQLDGFLLPMPRSHYPNCYYAVPRVKGWTPFFRYVVNHLPEPIRRHIAMNY